MSIYEWHFSITEIDDKSYKNLRVNVKLFLGEMIKSTEFQLVKRDCFLVTLWVFPWNTSSIPNNYSQRVSGAG